MTPQDLKNSILQLAIKGKLVEQRAEEGTGEELYKQIQAEKKKLIKEGKIKKEKPLHEITEDEIPFDIPESWKWYRIGEVFDIINGFTPLKSNPEFWDNGEIPWFTIEDVRRQGRFIYKTEKKISQKAISNNSNRIVPPESVLLCCTASVGEYAFTKIPLTTNQQFNAFVVKPHFSECVYPLYVYEFAKTLKDSLIQKAGKTTFNFLSVGKLSEMLFPLPPLAEQKRIVAKIEELLPLIDRYEEAWTKLEEFNKRFPTDMQKSLLQYAIQGKLVEQREEEGTGDELYKQIQAEKKKLIKEGKIKKEKPLPEITEDEIPFDIPESWKWVKLGDCSSYAQTKKKISSSNITPDLWSLDLEDIEKETGKILYYRNAGDKKIAGDKVCFESGQLLYSKLRPYLKKILIAPSDGICTPELVPFSMYGDISHEYIAYVLKAPHVDYAINSTTYGVKMPRVGTNTMINLLIPLPPLAEQKRIVAKLEEMLPLCEKLK